MGDLYENLNEKNINYGALNRFYQDLKSHDLSDLNYKIDNIDLSDVYNLIYTLHPNVDYLNFSANLPNTKVRLVLYSDYNAAPSTPIDIDYSFDRKNWTHYTVGNDITIPTDGKVYLRGNNDYFSVYDYDNNHNILYYHHFEFENNSQNTLNVEAHGNINSLLSKTNWNEITTLPEYCYYSIFQMCTSLTTAPTLPATTLADYCYEGMFYRCRNLNSIKCLATNISARNCTTNWVSGVAGRGTFVKAANMTGWTTGVNGIPSGWTVEDYTEPSVKPDTLTAGQNIDITDNTISAKGYVFDETKGSLATKFLKDEYDGGGIGTNTASGNYGSFAEGYNNTASGEYGSHAEGFLNTASGDSAHVEGQENTATHSAAHAEGRKTNATNNGAHSEGTYSDASGLASHAEGYGSTNYHNIASGDGSHTEGVCTRSQNKGEHAEGNANVSHKASDTYGDAGNTQHSIGIGTHYNSTKNAVEVMQNGDMYVLGVGGYQGTDTKVQNASIKTLQEYIASLEARIAALEGNTTVK